METSSLPFCLQRGLSAATGGIFFAISFSFMPPAGNFPSAAKESHLPEAKSRLSETEKRTAIRKAPAGGKTVTHRRQPNKAKSNPSRAVLRTVRLGASHFSRRLRSR